MGVVSIFGFILEKATVIDVSLQNRVNKKLASPQLRPAPKYPSRKEDAIRLGETAEKQWLEGMIQGQVVNLRRD